MGTGMTTSPEQEGCKGLYVGGLHPYVNEACLQVRIRAAPPAAAAHSPRPPVTRPRVRRFYTPAAAPFVQCCALRTPCTAATRRKYTFCMTPHARSFPGGRAAPTACEPCAGRLAGRSAD